MRLVYVTQRLPFGDGETFIIPEIEALLAAGHEVLIVPRISSDPVVHGNAESLLSRVRPVPGALPVTSGLAHALFQEPGRLAGAFWALRHSRPRRRIAYNALATAEGAWLARVARDWRADHIHAHWAHLTATLAMAASRLSGIPWSFTAHRYDVALNNMLGEKLRSARFGRFIAREILDSIRPLVDADAFGRALVIHMGVALPALTARPARRDVPVILCPARLVPIKGHGYLLDAAARLVARGVQFELCLAGDGTEAAAVALRIDELGLRDRVRLLGTVPHAQLLELYRDGQVDCVVLPSLYEGISVALMEAMAYGVPVAATRVGGVPELLEGGAGLLVPPEDPTALADALERLLVSPSARQALGEAGRRRVEEAFDVEVIADRLARGFAGEAMADLVGASCRES